MSGFIRNKTLRTQALRMRDRIAVVATGAVAALALGLISAEMALAAKTDSAGKSEADATTSATPAADAAKPEAAKPGTKKAAGKASSYGIPQVEFINDQIHQGWEAHSFSPSPVATDGEWCRRLFLDLLGRPPNVTELTRFLGDTAPDKKAQLVNRLLGDDYVEEYARNQTTLWTNVLIGRAGGTEENTLINRAGLQQSLRRTFQRNTPYDKMVYDIVSAKCVSRPGEKNFNGFVNFLAGNLAENGIEATAKTSQIFLGLQVRCTQCHNHPFNDWKQNQFWEMNAFFRQTRALRSFEGGRDVASVELAGEDFAGEDNHPQEAVLFYELRNGLTKAALPVFVDGTKLKSDSGYIDEVDRRTELAKMMIKSDYLGKSIVNRMWAHFLGFGFTKPIDDMGPHNAPSHPELLDGLAKQFKEHSYDLKELIRWIVLSEPYSLSAKFEAKNRKDDPSLGEKPMFSHFYLRQMRAEELYNSLLTATEAHKTKSYEQQETAKQDWLKQFTIAFGTDDNEETTTFNGTIPQTLMMMNGDLIKQAISIDKGSFLHQVAGDGKLNAGAKINHLYLAAFARKPTSSEVGLANQLMQLRKGDAAAALQDVWWALLNSNEFILNH